MSTLDGSSLSGNSGAWASVEANIMALVIGDFIKKLKSMVPQAAIATVVPFVFDGKLPVTPIVKMVLMVLSIFGNSITIPKGRKCHNASEFLKRRQWCR